MGRFYCIRVWSGLFSWEKGEWKFLSSLNIHHEQGTDGVLHHELTSDPDLALTSENLELMKKIALLVPAPASVEDFEVFDPRKHLGTKVDVRG